MLVKFPTLTKSNKAVSVNLEVQFVKGLPDFKILGVSGPSSQIMREKIRTAIKKSNFELKSTLRKIISFSNVPDQISEIPNSELQIVAMLLQASNQTQISNFSNYIFLADLYLDGKLMTSYSVEQILKLQSESKDKIFVVESKSEYLVLDNVIFLNNIAELKDFSTKNRFEIKFNKSKLAVAKPVFDSITGSGFSKLALVYGLKLKLHTLIVGSTGVGKTMLFESLPEFGISTDQIFFIDSSFSVKKFQEQLKVALEHKKTSYFILNELADFSRSLLDYLKIFFDQKSNIVILSTANPCYCGNRYSTEKICKCNPYQLKQYNKKLTLPLLDRFDILINVNDPEIKHLFYPELSIIDANQLVKQSLNSNLELDISGEYLLSLASEEFGFSKRRMTKIKNLAGLIAAFGSAEHITDKAIASALQYQNFIYGYTN